MKKAMLVLVAILGLASVADARPLRSQTTIVNNGNGVNNGNFFFQQTNRGLFGGIRSQTTIVNNGNNGNIGNGSIGAVPARIINQPTFLRLSDGRLVQIR